MTNIAIVGFGEAGSILAQELASAHRVTVWDSKLLTDSRQALHDKAQQTGVRAATSLADALTDASLVFSAVTAANALTLAQQAAPLLQSRQTFLDLNSVAPNTKRAAAEIIESVGAHYIDVAVMAPVPPKRLSTPLLLGGATAERCTEQLNALGFNARFRSTEVGEASAIKMCRSVMIKGLEALTTECLSAARQYGVEQAVLDSLHASFPSLGWDDAFPHYLISRVAEHGKRRAEEMQEVVKTLNDVDVPAAMSQATVATQQGLVDALAQRDMQYAELTPFVWQQTLDKIYAKP
ncbi:NAD(P)-dependent oxidoreductase [Winslowiella iniecta]|uniref:6-phosphogluconate dehydrogenase n=1 Tax=Winslowiella iniecta TaxID=1560201 RepID=A0A0L7SW41_9GAMM|nr:NAD(P)-dependent oxidoreductase [Winslowiella iniecta]KOC87338.1 6-phosphogluconate dehydrogenase [Winslowiella iniecta]KOC89811.1 6-phosphogluconate dehydrogenase [Winslowiella iniecta]